MKQDGRLSSAHFPPSNNVKDLLEKKKNVFCGKILCFSKFATFPNLRVFLSFDGEKYYQELLHLYAISTGNLCVIFPILKKKILKKKLLKKTLFSYYLKSVTISFAFLWQNLYFLVVKFSRSQKLKNFTILNFRAKSKYTSKTHAASEFLSILNYRWQKELNFEANNVKFSAHAIKRTKNS